MDDQPVQSLATNLSWFSSWVRSVFTALAGGNVRVGGMVMRPNLAVADSGDRSKESTDYQQ